MKRNVTSTLHLAKPGIREALFAFVLMLFGFSAFGQGSNAAHELEYLSSVKWKATPELNNTLSQEQVRMNLALSSPTLAIDEKALYKAYKRLMDYVAADVQAGKTVDKAILDSYDKVLTDALTDATIKDMPAGLLETYIPGLVESLTETQVPIPVNAN